MFEEIYEQLNNEKASNHLGNLSLESLDHRTEKLKVEEVKNDSPVYVSEISKKALELIREEKKGTRQMQLKSKTITYCSLCRKFKTAL